MTKAKLSVDNFDRKINKLIAMLNMKYEKVISPIKNLSNS